MKKSGLLNIQKLFSRGEPAKPVAVIIMAGLGGMLAIAIVSWLGNVSARALLMAPFGATCVLLFSVPDSPLSQPANVIGGHLISTTIGLLAYSLLPVEWWSLGLAVGLAISAMAALRITHPPAGADPLVVMLVGQSWGYLLFPVAIGSTILVIIAMLYRKLAHSDNS
ncbi:HPP family protein [Sulfuriflexus mobilis]|uniref:HPP family protein n=1 Tax=Sulfuriflexus mobilis TaxID=1811807 RepID=UPI000F848ACA|nr:HPP family protein [Sulfuriflexus mobilis]